MHRYRFVITRPLQLNPVLIGISLVTFILTHMIPGDPAPILLGIRACTEAIAAIHEKFGLDKPLFVQYFYFLGNLIQGDFGKSIIYRAPVLGVVVERIMPTLSLILLAVAISAVLSSLLASIAATKRGGASDQAIRLFSTFGLG